MITLDSRRPTRLNPALLPADLARRYGNDFVRGITFVLSWEKELSLEHGDTVALWGIDKRWHPNEFSVLLTLHGPARLSRAIAYYHKVFWLPILELTPFVSERIFLFDTAVNQGLSVARALASPPSLLSVLALRRIRWYSKEQRAGPPHYFLRGWLNRVFALLDGLEIKS